MDSTKVVAVALSIGTAIVFAYLASPEAAATAAAKPQANYPLIDHSKVDWKTIPAEPNPSDAGG